MPLRVLHLSNFSADRCGIRNFGDQLSCALRNAGCEVTDWDIQYSHMYELIQRGEPAYLPDGVEQRFDILQYNWHPITTNTFGPGHFPWPKGSRPLVSVYLHDIPPWSGCPFADRADLLITAEPAPLPSLILPYPICDWIPDLPDPAPDFTVGWSGVRGDGAAAVRDACETAGYAMNPPGEGWISYEDEIRRLARSTVNVAWYHEGRGLSGGASQLASAQRALILNTSPMFAHFWDFTEEIYLVPPAGTLAAALELVHAVWRHGSLRVPHRLLTERGWTRGAQTLLTHWKEILRG